MGIVASLSLEIHAQVYQSQRKSVQTYTTNQWSILTDTYQNPQNILAQRPMGLGTNNDTQRPNLPNYVVGAVIVVVPSVSLRWEWTSVAVGLPQSSFRGRHFNWCACLLGSAASPDYIVAGDKNR